LRILFLSVYNPLDIGSGPSTGLYYLSQELVKLGCEVHILTIKTKTHGEIDHRVNIHYENHLQHVPLGRWLTISNICISKIKKLIKDYRIDVIHGRSPSSISYALSKNKKMPFIVSIHGTSFGEIASYIKIPFSFLKKRLLYDAAIVQPSWAFFTSLEYKAANKIISVSKALAEEALNYYRLPSEKLVVIHNGVHVLPITQAETENVILSVGRMVWRKGFTYLIEAMPNVLKENPNTKLILVGDGVYKVFLEEYTKKLKVEKSVLFYGNLPREKLFLLYQKARLYVQPSLYEPLGNTILEAMASEKPVIATKVGGIPEIITHGKDGFLIEPESYQQIAQTIKTLLSDSHFSKKLGKNARAKMRKYFSWESAAKKTLQIYEELLHN